MLVSRLVVFDEIVPLYAGSLSDIVAPVSTYSMPRFMVMFAGPVSVMTGFSVSIKMLLDVRFASVTYKVLFWASRTAMLNVALLAG